ncbi:hypothetical protein EET67_09900 [Pseudaminobacter arsenicus]|uniref:DUF2460 domain-containing protein n=1 Tax=Borborobacter arsenicus TaxID=1851146 RepID=A0A432V6Y2_9HYPH|nr:DUF2460 domain-containing protein [Pseudaminobacter arsenicus]RUM97918.1 hypothetical protein EET67_09900 [Pseudaminobacter arsenicus]
MVDNVILSERVALGFRGGPTFSTDKVSAITGRERRLQNRAIAIHRYSWSQENRKRDLIDELRGFWFDRRGDLKAWLLKDWADFSAVSEPLGIGDGTATDFQIVKTYSAGVNPYVRVIRHIKAGTLTVFLDDLPQTETTHYTVGATGLISFVSAPSVGQVVTASFEFYVPVRFDGDEFMASIPFATPQLLNVDDIQAVEVIP